MSDPVEIAARALGPEYFDPDQQQRADALWREEKRDQMRAQARAVIRGLVLAGFKVLGREATEEMVEAGYAGRLYRKEAVYTYGVMFDAAPDYSAPPS